MECDVIFPFWIANRITDDLWQQFYKGLMILQQNPENNYLLTLFRIRLGFLKISAAL